MLRELKHTTYKLLRSSERYTKTDMVYITKGGFWLFLGHGVAIVLGLTLSVGFANLLPKESFGTYKFVLSLAAILGSLSLTGLGVAITRSVAQGFEGTLRTGFITNLKWSAFVFFGGLAGAGYYFINDNLTLSLSMLIAGSLTPIISSASFYADFLKGKQDFQTQTLYGILHSFVSVLALLATAALTDEPLAIVAVYFISNALAVAFFYRRILAKYTPSESTDISMVTYSKHLSVMNMAGIVAAHIDKVLIFHFLGAAPLAIYAFAIAPVDQLRSGNKIIQALTLPKLSARPFAELQRTVPGKAFVLLLVAILITTAYVVLAPFLYKLLFPQYLESVFLSKIYALTLLAMPITLFNQMLLAHQKKKALYTIQGIVTFAKIALFFTLLPFYGLTGLIVALILTKVLSASLAVFYSLKAAPTS